MSSFRQLNSTMRKKKKTKSNERKVAFADPVFNLTNEPLVSSPAVESSFSRFTKRIGTTLKLTGRSNSDPANSNPSSNKTTTEQTESRIDYWRDQGLSYQPGPETNYTTFDSPSIERTGRRNPSGSVSSADSLTRQRHTPIYTPARTEPQREPSPLLPPNLSSKPIHSSAPSTLRLENRRFLSPPRKAPLSANSKPQYSLKPRIDPLSAAQKNETQPIKQSSVPFSVAEKNPSSISDRHSSRLPGEKSPPSSEKWKYSLFPIEQRPQAPRRHRDPPSSVKSNDTSPPRPNAALSGDPVPPSRAITYTKLDPVDTPSLPPKASSNHLTVPSRTVSPRSSIDESVAPSSDIEPDFGFLRDSSRLNPPRPSFERDSALSFNLDLSSTSHRELPILRSSQASVLRSAAPRMAANPFLVPTSAKKFEDGLTVMTAAIKAAREFQDLVNKKARRLGINGPNYEALELIGKGSYGRVYKSRNLNSSEIVAVKVIDIDVSDYKERSEATLNDIQKEIKALKTLKDVNARNVNMMHEAFVFDADVWLVSDLCTGGSLRTLMRAIPGTSLDERYIIPIARELAEALKWVHKAGIIHRDVKSANVLINEDGQLQLCDFGVAGTLETKTNKRNTVMGTCHWMPPEMVGRLTYGIIPQGYGTEVDIWSYGCTLFELATGAPPNSRVPQDELNDELRTRAPRLEGTKFSQGLRDLVALCLQKRPRDRPSAEKLQEHYYIDNSLQSSPTSLLTELLKNYKTWEKSGGERASLWMEGGAPTSELSAEDEGDSWTFDTIRPAAAESSDNDDGSDSHSQAYLGRQDPTSAVRDFAPGSQGQPSSQDRRRIPRNALSRMFDPDDEYNYAQRRRRNSLPFSDLPLREQTRDSQIQDNQIDLGEFDSVPDIVIPDLSIPDMTTIRASRPNHRFRDSRLEEDEGEAEEAFGYRADEESNRRATKDWKFPSLNAPVDEPSNSSRRRTQDWTFPTMTAEPRQDFGLEPLQETVSAPTSPPRTAFNLDDVMPRPSSADPTAAPLSPSSLDMDPFGLETSSDEEQNAESDGQSNRTSFHRQSRSEPSNLDVAAAEAEAARREAAEEYDLTADESYPEFLRARNNSISSDEDTDPSRRFQQEARLAWLRQNEATWSNHPLFNPEPLELPPRSNALNIPPPESYMPEGQYPMYTTNHVRVGDPDFPLSHLRMGDTPVMPGWGGTGVQQQQSQRQQQREQRRLAGRNDNDNENGDGGEEDDEDDYEYDYGSFDPASLNLPMPLPPPAEALVDGASPETMENALVQTIGDLAGALDIFQGGLQATMAPRRRRRRRRGGG
ncbi:MAG: hypothetical protein M1837_001830 [Sclerophora amabilis]|nr:MAG: hypothetical protein M1837_001830 [Sclerophora amabilis]